MTDHLNAAVLAGSTSLVAQAMTAAAPPWWVSLLYSVGAAVAGALLNWLLRQGPRPPPPDLVLSGGGA